MCGIFKTYVSLVGKVLLMQATNITGIKFLLLKAKPGICTRNPGLATEEYWMTVQGSHFFMMTKFHDISRFVHKFPGIIFIFI